MTSAARYQHNSTRQSPIRHRTSCHSSKRTPEGMNFPNQSLKNVLQLSTSFLPTTASGAAASPELSCLWENRPRHESKTAKRGRVCSQPPSVPRCSSSWESYQWLCGRTTKKTPPQTQGLEAGCSLAEIRRKYNSRRQVLDEHLRGFQLCRRERVFPGPWSSGFV